MDDQSYFEKRALQEEEAARTATCEQARKRHGELAAAYILRSRLAAIGEDDAALSKRTGPGPTSAA